MGAAGGGEHGPAVLLETTTRKKKTTQKPPLEPLCASQAFPPHCPTGHPCTGTSCGVPCAHGEPPGGSVPPWGHQSRVCAASWHWVSAAGGLHGACGAVLGQGGLAPQPGKRVGAVVLAAVSPGGAPSARAEALIPAFRREMRGPGHRRPAASPLMPAYQT